MYDFVSVYLSLWVCEKICACLPCGSHPVMYVSCAHSGINATWLSLDVAQGSNWIIYSKRIIFTLFLILCENCEHFLLLSNNIFSLKCTHMIKSIIR